MNVRDWEQDTALDALDGSYRHVFERMRLTPANEIQVQHKYIRLSGPVPRKEIHEHSTTIQFKKSYCHPSVQLLSGLRLFLPLHSSFPQS